jgi:hypothetical protein
LAAGRTAKPIDVFPRAGSARSQGTRIDPQRNFRSSGRPQPWRWG